MHGYTHIYVQKNKILEYAVTRTASLKNTVKLVRFLPRLYRIPVLPASCSFIFSKMINMGVAKLELLNAMNICPNRKKNFPTVSKNSYSDTDIIFKRNKS